MTHHLIRKKFNKLFVVNFKLKKISEEMIELQPLLSTPKDGIAAHMIAKSYKTYGVILNLCSHGFGEDAQMLARTLFDSYLVIGNVLEDETEETARQYLNFDDMVRINMFNKVKDRPIYAELIEERKRNPKPKQEAIEEVAARAEKWLKKYGPGYRQKWFTEKTIGKTMGYIADKIKMKPFYETAYNLQSQLVHSEPRSGDYYLHDDGERLWMNIKPGEKGIDLALVSSFNVMIGIALGYDEQFKLGNDERIRALIPEYMQAVNELGM